MGVQKMTALGITTVFLLAAGCAGMGFMAGRPDASSQVAALGGGTVNGRVTFTQEDGYVLVEGDFEGLTPGKHGIHVHEHGDCGGVLAEAAGGHYNPGGGTHGMPGMAESHEGDLGNLVADDWGRARFTLKDSFLRLSGDNSILGRSVIVHAQADDLISQPSGDSGARVACGPVVAVQR
jgi:Cu-Zn family superoxide dismutase